MDRCRLFCSVSSPLQSVQRAETWGVIVLLQAAVAFHVGTDHLNVVGHVVGLMPDKRKPGLTRVTKVKGHACRSVG